MAMLNAIIIEDEYASRNALKNLIDRHCPSIRLVGYNDLDTMAKGINAIRKCRPDVVFLDIKLSETNQTENGFALLEQVKDIPFELVVVTAYGDYSQRAINEDYRTCYFIQKPFDFEKIVAAVERVETKYLKKINQKHQGREFSTINGKIGIPSSSGIEYVPLSKIVMLEAYGSITKLWLWLELRPLTVSHNLGWFEKQLAQVQQGPFCRTHSSYIANRDYVRFFKHEGKKGLLTMENDATVKVSEDRKQNILQWLKG